MCAKITQYSRLSHHTIAGSANAGLTFSVPGSEDFTDGTWTAYDLALSEIGVNEEDCKVYIRIDNDIKEFQMVGSTAGGENLSQTLALGNNTGGQNIIIDNGDIIGSNGTTDQPNIQFDNSLIGGPKIVVSAGDNIFGITQTGYIELASNGVSITSDSNNFSESSLSLLSSQCLMKFEDGGMSVLLDQSKAKIGRDIGPVGSRAYSEYLTDGNSTIHRLSVENVAGCLTEEYFRAKPSAQTGEANYHYRLFTDNTNDNHDIILYYDSNFESYGKYYMTTMDLKNLKHIISHPDGDALVTQQDYVNTINATPVSVFTYDTMKIDLSNVSLTTTVIIDATFVGMEVAGTQSYTSNLRASFKTISGVVTQIGTTDIYERKDFASASTGFNVTSNVIRPEVTGEISTNIDWNISWTYKILNN